MFFEPLNAKFPKLSEVLKPETTSNTHTPNKETMKAFQCKTPTIVEQSREICKILEPHLEQHLSSVMYSETNRSVGTITGYTNIKSLFESIIIV